jgi:two-component system chemotaxis response regulator CheB
LQRAHQERAVLARKMAKQERAEERHNLADQLETRAHEYEEDARLVFELMRNGFGATDTAASDEKEMTKGNGKDQAQR